jgi:sterol desaturase/sphingolipid hydroxylase (fatty acid hydroxylase superfamily)
MLTQVFPANVTSAVASALSRAVTDTAHAFLISLVSAASMLGVMMWLERRAMPARPPSLAHVGMNLSYTVALLAIVAAMRPVTLIASLTLSRTFGLGIIAFPPGIAGWIVAFTTVLIATDLLEYLWHRAQHAFGPLWKMHELHHSAEHYDVTLTYLHFWLEPLLKVSFLYPLIGVMFQVPGHIATAVGLIFMANHHFAHLNGSIHFGRFSLCISSPHYHRSHHSRHEAHFNKNFCDLLPLWDLLFGTFHRVPDGQFVDVGIDSVETPRTLAEALVWPWRRGPVGAKSRQR